MTTMFQIAADLEEHAWYVEVVRQTIAELEAYLACWAGFADYLGEPVL
jgi:hypothetical protein